MTDSDATVRGQTGTPAHLWATGIISLLWNSVGGVDYVMTQTENAEYLDQFTPDQKAFFLSMPAWTEFFWALGVWGAIIGSLLLLLRGRHAVTAFAASLVGLAVSTVWQLGLSGADLGKIFGPVPILMNVFIWGICIALWAYARRQVQVGVLR
jgi:hypothetical protein